MLSELKFVQGVVAKKDFVPALTHFRIENRRVQGYNGKIALSAPIDFDIDCTPKALPLVKAIAQCDETVQLGMTPSGRLSVKSGKFRSYIDCVEGSTPHVKPEGKAVSMNGEVLLDALNKLLPFIADDAARPWSNGVLFDGQSAFATNNVIIAEYWLGAPMPERICIPIYAVKEMLRIKKAPCHFQMTDNSMTAHYEDGTWLRTNLIDIKWPDVRRILDRDLSTVKTIPPEFFQGLTKLSPFIDVFKRVIFEPGLMRTHAKHSEEGAQIELDWLTESSTYALPMLQKLEGVAEKIDLSQYPEPVPWVGNSLRGVLVGLRWIEENVGS